MKLSLNSMVFFFSLTGFLVSATTLSSIGLSSTIFSIFARAITLCFSCLVLFLAARNLKFNFSVFLTALLVFWALYFLRIFFDTLIIDRTLSKPDYIYWVWSIGASFLPMIAAIFLRQDNIRGIFPFIVLTFVYCSFLAAAFGTSYFSSDGGVSTDIGRISMSSLNPISTGHLGLSTVIVCLFQIFVIRSNLSLITVVGIIGLILGTYLIIVTGSRGPIFAGLCVMLYILYIRGILRSFYIIMLLIPFLYYVMQLAIFIQETTDLQTVSRLIATGAENDQSALGRLGAYVGAIDQFLNSPILGSALEEFTTGYYPHNIFLESLMSIGIFGGMLFFFLHFYILSRGILIIKYIPKCSWVLLLYIQFLAGSMVSGSIWNSTYLWVTLGASYALLRSLHPGRLS